MPSQRPAPCYSTCRPLADYSPIEMLFVKLKALLRPTRLVGQLVFLYEAGSCPPAQRFFASSVYTSLRPLPDKVITASARALPRMSVTMRIDATGRVHLEWPGPAG